LAAIEGLARVDVVCIDKTGTITEPELTVSAAEPLMEDVDLPRVLAELAGADPDPNASMGAILRAFPRTGTAPAATSSSWRVPFSSARRFSAIGDDGGGWVLGAPDVLASAARPAPVGLARTAADRVEHHSRAGRRVLLVAWTPERPDAGLHELSIVGLVALEEQIRREATETVAFFAGQGVTVKVLSGDDPRTVAAVAARVGIVGNRGPVDARSLPPEPEALADAVEAHNVFGRVDPQHKRSMVGALQRRGHVVAMTGDGVNDVLALNDADLGVAMGSGSPASRAVAPVVLLDSSFAAFPAVVGEGRRVIANIERVANLFVTKTVYATLLALAVGVAQLPFPFLPRHLTLVSSLTIGVPAFFLALAPNDRRAVPGFAGSPE
jgi:cation-transporting ATPase E